MKHLLYALLAVLVTQASYGNPIGTPDQAYAYTTVGRNTAAVYWSSKGCDGLSQVITTPDSTTGNDLQCINPPNPDLYAPTVVLFSGKTGDIIKHIKFFDESCAYIPVSLTGDRSRVTLVVHVGSDFTFPNIGTGIGSDIISSMDNNYPDCPYTDGGSVTLTETRSVRSGKLIYNTPLQDIGTYDFN